MARFGSISLALLLICLSWGDAGWASQPVLATAADASPLSEALVRGQGGPQPWTMPQPLKRFGIRMGGWLEQGITVNGFDRTDGFNGTVGTNDFDGEYQMNQFWLYFTKPVNTQRRGWDIGGHVDMIYGTDWRFGINNGLEERINGFDRQTYGLVIPQMYAEVGVGNLSVKLGHFAGILDYEAVPAVVNPFYSHSLCYGFTVPQLVTGVLSEYKLTKQLSIQSGVHRGWMQFEDNNDELDLMAGFKWTSADGETSLAWAFSTGPQDLAGEQDRFVYSLVAKQQLTGNLQYVLVHNLGWENNGDFRSTQDAEWYGINQYFLYTINPKWQASARIEWLRDDDGARVFGPPPVAGLRAWDGGPGFAGDFFELTLGLNYRPCPNLLFRPEVRWDWYDGTRSLAGELPYDNGDEDSQFTTGVDMIFTF
jgi:hypothetical protein